MVEIKYVFGDLDGTLPLDPSHIHDDMLDNFNDSYLQSLVAGKIVSLDANGYVKLAEDGDIDYGILLNNALGNNAYENPAAIASGLITAVEGGGIFLTDQVVEDDIVPGDKLYIGTGANAGLLTKTDPGSGNVVAVARTGNSAADKSVVIRLF